MFYDSITQMFNLTSLSIDRCSDDKSPTQIFQESILPDNKEQLTVSVPVNKTD